MGKHIATIKTRYDGTTGGLLGYWVWECPACNHDPQRVILKKFLKKLVCKGCLRVWEQEEETEYSYAYDGNGVDQRLWILMEEE